MMEVILLKDLVMKFYSPLTADFCMDELEWEDEEESVLLDGNDLIDYSESISDALAKENASLDGGDLMPYYHVKDGVSEKAVSAVVSAELYRGALCGCATVRLREPLNEAECSALKEYLLGQYSDGFGEGFEQREIRVDGGALYVHLWQPDGFAFETEITSEPQEMPLMAQKKYEITDIAHPQNPALHRICALCNVTQGVKAGDLGGYVQSEENLTQEMDGAWIDEDAVCCDAACVANGAVLRGYALASGHALVSGSSVVSGNACVTDNGVVLEGILRGHARVCGNGIMRSNIATGLAPVAEGNATIMGTLAGAVYLSGHAFILPGAIVDHPLENTLGIDSQRAVLYDKTPVTMRPKKTPER